MNARLLAVFAWASTLSMVWVFVLRVVEIDIINVAAFIFFLAVAIFSSAAISRKED